MKRAEPLIVTPILAFGLCLALTVGATFFASESARMENAGRFERSIGAFRDTLRNRMTVYTNALLYTRNLFNVKPDLTEDEFKRFVSQMNLSETYPGVQTIGFVHRLPAEEGRRLLKKMGVPLEEAHFSPDRGIVDIAQYVERVNTGSSSVRGLDMGYSLERRETMDEARDTGGVVATDRVIPIALPKSGVYAFLVFTPVYKPDAPVTNVEERRKALIGFIYGGFRAINLFGRVTEDARFRSAKFQVKIYDGVAADPSRLLYSEGPAEIADALMSRAFDFKFANHAWTISIVAPKDYSVPALRWLPGLIFGLGFLFSVLVAFALRRSREFAGRLQDDIVVREQTEHLLSEARLDAEAANRAKSVFLANISHEIRTPLGVMIGFAEMALHQDQKSERGESLETVIRNGRELTRIIGDVLDVSKIESQASELETAPMSVKSLVRDISIVWKPQIEAKGLKFKIDVDPSVPELIVGDETRIKQVLTNLLSNSLKFTSAGQITMSVGAKPSAQGTEDSLTFEVRDTGIGVSDQQLERLFKPFSQGDNSITRKFGGSGLGLALSRAIAKRMGGDLELIREGGPQAGSLFRFSFNAETYLSPELPKVTRALSASLEGKSILLVDDSPDNRALVSLMLKKAHAVVDVAVDGDDGIQKALKNPYDLILMDIQMPNKDGYTAFKELRDIHHVETPIIALTAHALREERDKALAIGFSAYITKPVDRETLVRISSETIL